MRNIWQVLLFVMPFVFNSCNGVPPKATTRTQTICMDDEHNVVAQKNAQVPRYEIRPCAALVVQLKGYSFTIPPTPKVSGPNAVHLYQGGNKYRARWDDVSSFTLSSQSLESLEGQQVFPGFRQGESYILGIGHDNFPPPDKELVFKPMWLGAIRVAADGT